jgi:hypothetical protein
MRFIASGIDTDGDRGDLATAAVPAYAQSCHELWTERNSYYKARGYCFKTDRAINYFGNAGCRYHDEDRLPLTAGERRRIGEIRRLERAKGCD